jgi:hypothetical protein
MAGPFAAWFDRVAAAAVSHPRRLGHPWIGSRWALGRLWPSASVEPKASRTHLAARRGDGRRPNAQVTAISAPLVKATLGDLGDPVALRQSELRLLPCVSQNGPVADEVRALLVDVICELAGSSAPRDAEAGPLLYDYNVKRVRSHEVIMERLHLSRPTFYRRLNRGRRRPATQRAQRVHSVHWIREPQPPGARRSKLAVHCLRHECLFLIALGSGPAEPEARPCSTAHAATSVRERTPNLLLICSTWPSGGALGDDEPGGDLAVGQAGTY